MVLLTLLLLSLAGCGGTDSLTDPVTSVATTVLLSATTLSFSSFGDSQQLTATVRDQNGDIMSGASVASVSSTSTVASVSPTGLVTAVADGAATISATSGSATENASVTVREGASIGPAGGEVSLADDAVNLVFPAGAVSDASVGGASMTVAVMAAAAVVFIIFGWVSRRFERQADVFAVRHLDAHVDRNTTGLISAGAVAAVCDALGRIALLNAVAAGRRSWRHGSIAWRQAYLRSIVGRSAAAMPIDRQVRRIKVAAAVILTLAAIVVILG